MKVLVTGGAGYIGSHVCKALAQVGFQPVTVDHLGGGHSWAVKWGPLEPVDVRDEVALDSVFQRHAPAAVLHFAAHIEVGESVRAPLKYYANNVGGVMSVLGAMRRHGVPAIVFSSTAAVYGDPNTTPITEAHPLRPLSPYGSSKAMGEKVLFDDSKLGGLEVVALRYFNAAGADLYGDIGEAHAPETHLIPLMLRAIRDPAFTLDVFGRDFDTRDGTAVRDYVHVSDLADAHVSALRYLLNGGRSVALNIGTGNGATVQEVIDAGARILGRTPAYRDGPRRDGDPPTLVADPSAASRVLNWRPTISELSTIVRTAAAWDARMRARA